MSKRMVILGAGESGAGAAVLAKAKGFDVFVSDKSSIKPKYKEMLRWYYRHGRDDGGTNRDGLFLTERRCLIHPSQFITADTGNSYGEYTYPRRRGMANNDRPFPLDQSERISPFLRRTGTIKRGHATEIPIYRD